MSGENPDSIVIVGMARTAIGGLLGQFQGLSAPELGGVAIAAALARAGLPGEAVDQVLMGNVLSAGQGQAPARQAALKAGLPLSAQATTLNKMCGSGMQAAILARAAIQAGEADIVIAGGMESMSNAPFLLPKMRAGAKYGHDRVLDHMALDGLEDAYEGLPMGRYADQIAAEYQFTRAAQDQYALETLVRAKEASDSGRLADEIIPVPVRQKSETAMIATDELPQKARPEKIPTLKPAFSADGTVTAANASAISDGAAALVLMRRADAEKQGRPILAEIVATAAHAQAPAYFTTAPVQAIGKVLAKAGWDAQTVDLWEVNEAFAVVPMIAMAELGIAREKMNVNGGACAVGHPIGASGARIMVTLLAEMMRRGVKTGIASLCIGGGEATAIALRRD